LAIGAGDNQADMDSSLNFPPSLGHDPASVRAAEPVSAPSATSHAYRPHIDGLRTLAVLPVVLNHVGMRGFGGGYVGVDIFFVISGYLITGILARDLAHGQHSIAAFYRRRVLRIFPALFVMLAATTVFACVAMLPGELVRYARSLAATTIFGSNVLFFSETSYFDAGSHVKPLLHTWSLAIEEQFYIAWPLLLAWVGVDRPVRLKTIVALVSVASFVAALLIMKRDASAAFYLLPSRAWELGLGGGLALLKFGKRRRWLDEILGAAGLAMILGCVWKYNEQTAFPGLAALPPCLGAALLILTGANGTWTGRLLSLPPVVFIGRISYSLYLWHWPVIVFTAIWLFLAPTPTVMIGEIALSLVLAALSWRFVETPFRVAGLRWPTSRVLIGGVCAMAIALIAATALIASGGIAGRFTAAQAAVADYADRNDEDSYRRGTCFISDYRDSFDAARCLRPKGNGKPVLLLVGDSHGAHLWPGLARLADRYDIVQATFVGCRPLLYPGKSGPPCQRFFRSILGEWVPSHRPAGVLLAGRWQADDLGLLGQTLDDPRLKGSRVMLVGTVPQYRAALPRLLVYADRDRDPDLPRRFADRAAIAVDRQLSTLTAAHGASYIPVMQRLCPNGQCRYWAAPGVPLQFDYGHFSAQGSEVAVALVAPDIAAAMARPLPDTKK
jgi:peptidoglycan/LPS O-acetylase OafA/YrhL